VGQAQPASLKGLLCSLEPGRAFSQVAQGDARGCHLYSCRSAGCLAASVMSRSGGRQVQLLDNGFT
jgi:hypothetical protein